MKIVKFVSSINFSISMERAATKIHRKKFREALELLDKFENVKEGIWQFYFLKGHCFYRLGSVIDAYKMFDIIVRTVSAEAFTNQERRHVAEYLYKMYDYIIRDQKYLMNSVHGDYDSTNIRKLIKHYMPMK